MNDSFFTTSFEFLVRNWKSWVEILLLALILYYLFLFIRGTRGAPVVTGFILTLLVLTFLSQFLRFEVINWLLSRFLAFFAIAIIVIFQPEIRRILGELGRQQFFFSQTRALENVDAIVAAVRSLSERKTGALIAIQRAIGIRGIVQSGVSVECLLTSEMLEQIFHPNTPLHDGGVVIHGNHILSAGSIFPLTQTTELNRELGMRHRAAIGLTEETDAVVIVVSEETGIISLAFKGRIVRRVDEPRLRRFISALLVPRRPDSRLWPFSRRADAVRAERSPEEVFSEFEREVAAGILSR
ncbi:MAG: TIGR00159 family protein [Verrucomicrobiae bacterium]|nr:TIGR00159 family protein [Verrucomicrobiae bacterium]